MATTPALVSAATSLIVGLVALGLAVMAWRARARSGNRQLLFVGAAFVVIVAKSLFSAWDVTTVTASSPLGLPQHVVPHDYLELVLSLFDLLTIALLAAPFALKRAAP
jgi:heme A synthase